MSVSSSQSAPGTWQKTSVPNLDVRGGNYFRARIGVNGKQRTKALVARSFTEAKRELPGVLAQLNGSTGIVPGDRSVTLGTLVAAYLEREQGVNGSLAPRSLDRHRIVLNKHVVPALRPSTRVADLTAGRVRQMIEKLNDKGLAGASVRTCVSALSSVLDYGVRNETLTRNPVRDLTRGDLPSAKRQTDPRYLTAEQVSDLLKALGDEFRPIAATLFYGGLRVSECLSLRWADIDFEANTIRVRGTKTAASDATIPLLPPLAATLKLHRQGQARRGFQRVAADALVFPTFTGKPQSRRNVLRAIASAGCKVGLSKSTKAKECPAEAQPVGCHDLRHSLAANAFEMGLSPVEVSKLLRHANAQVTLAVYAGLSGDHVATLSTKLAALGGGQ